MSQKNTRVVDSDSEEDTKKTAVTEPVAKPAATKSRTLKRHRPKSKHGKKHHHHHHHHHHDRKKDNQRKRRKDPHAPKGPVTAYLQFAKLNRSKAIERLQKEQPDVKPTTVMISKKLGDMWKNLSP